MTLRPWHREVLSIVRARPGVTTREAGRHYYPHRDYSRAVAMHELLELERLGLVEGIAHQWMLTAKGIAA